MNFTKKLLLWKCFFYGESKKMANGRKGLHLFKDLLPFWFDVTFHLIRISVQLGKHIGNI